MGFNKLLGKMGWEQVGNESGVTFKHIRDNIDRRQLMWFGHMVRMSDERKVEQTWSTSSDYKRKRGRPAKTWNNEVEKVLKKKNLTWRKAKNRKA